MKKLLTMCTLGALSLAVYAQGLVSIQDNSVLVYTNSADFEGGTLGKMDATPQCILF